MQFAANAIQKAMGPEPSVVEAGYKAREGEETMQALVWQGNMQVEVLDCKIPDITQDDDVVLKVTGTTICGSDLHLYHSEIIGMQKGDILGHEFMGKVDRVGKNVTKLKEGDRVVVSFQIACGKCRYCQKKLSSFCERTNDSSLMQTMYGGRDAGFFGYSHFTGGFPGGQAEYVKVPFAEVNCLPIPDDVTDEEAIYLSDVLPTSYHCVVDTGVTEGDTVAIWGLGPIGLSAAKWCQLKGAKRVIGIDGVPFRLNWAKEKLGIEVINFNDVSDIPATLLEMVPGGVDRALDCGTFHEPKTMFHKVQKALLLETDVAETANECIKSVRKMGSVGLISAYAGITNAFNIGAVMEKGVRFIGNGQAPVHLYWEEILNDYIRTKKFDVSLILTHRFSIEEFSELYGKFDKRVDGLLKTFVETKFSSPAANGYPKLTKVADLPEK